MGMKHKESGGKGHDDKEVCVKEMAACADDEKCKGLHMKVQMLMKKEGGDKKEGGYGGKGGDGKKDDGKDYGKKDDGKDYGKKDDGNKGPPPKKDYGSDKKDGGPDKKSAYGKKDYGKKGRKLAGHEHHGDDHKNDHGKAGEKKPGKDGDKKPEKDGEKKPGYGKEGGDQAPSAELKAAMEACKKNELCRALMECKMKHKESGGKGHDDKEVCVKEMAACADDEKCKGLHMKVQMLMKKEGGYGGKGDDGKKDDGKDYGKKDDGKDYGKKDYGNGAKKGEGGGYPKKEYGSDKKGGKPGSSRKLHQH